MKRLNKETGWKIFIIISLIWIGVVFTSDLILINDLKSNFGLTIGEIESRYLSGGKFLGSVLVRYEVNGEEYLSKTLSFSSKRRLPPIGETCLLAYDKNNPESVSLVFYFDAEGYEYSTNMDTIVKKSSISFSFSGAAKYE